jgi:hypothetical protein
VAGGDELVLAEVSFLLACCLTDKKDCGTLLRTLKEQLSITEDQAKVLFAKLQSATLTPFESASAASEQVRQCQVCKTPAMPGTLPSSQLGASVPLFACCFMAVKHAGRCRQNRFHGYACAQQGAAADAPLGLPELCRVQDLLQQLH